MTVDDDTQVKDGVRWLNQDVANQKWLTLDQIPALRRRGVEKAGFTCVRHHPVAREPVVSNLERSRKFVTGGLLLSCTKEKAEGTSSLISYATAIPLSYKTYKVSGHSKVQQKRKKTAIWNKW